MPWGQLNYITGDDFTSDIPSRIFFENNEITIGRVEDNSNNSNNINNNKSESEGINKNIVIIKPYISGKHFTIIKLNNKLPEEYNIIDYSSNGTYLNGELIGKGKTKLLQPNDMIAFKFRGIEKLVYQFSLVEPGDSLEPPTKYQRSSLNKRSHSSLNSEDETLTKRINSLERENQQQEVRIANYITKLESSAREIGNLQSSYQTTRDSLIEKENQLNDMKQTKYFIFSYLFLVIYF